MSPMSQWKAKQKIRDNKQMHASQLWQQGLNDAILKSCDTIILNTLPLVVQYKFFFADECANTKLLARKSLRFLS